MHTYQQIMLKLLIYFWFPDCPLQICSKYNLGNSKWQTGSQIQIRHYKLRLNGISNIFWLVKYTNLGMHTYIYQSVDVLWPQGLPALDKLGKSTHNLVLKNSKFIQTICGDKRTFKYRCN